MKLFFERLSACLRGSMLAEIAIGISILGLVSGIFISKAGIARRAAKIQTTKRNIDASVAALAAYLASNSRLPRPCAFPDSGGVEGAGGSELVGKIPFNTIGIAEKFTLDGNGRPLVYVAEPALCNTKRMQMSEFWDDGNYFCRSLPLQRRKIEILRQDNSAWDMIAFVIDTADNVPTCADGKVHVKPSANTFWIRRNLLLIQYLKTTPCCHQTTDAPPVFRSNS